MLDWRLVFSGSQVFRFQGHKMVGVFHKPDRRRFPAVLFLHGFPGSEKNVDVQRELLRRGIGSFAPHFCGAWGSEGSYLFSTLVDQARAALVFMRSRLGADPRRLAVFGFSMGGWTAIHLAAKTKGLRGAVAVAPVGGKEMVGPHTRDFIARASVSLRAGPADVLLRDFARSVREMDPAESASRLPCPLLLVHGDADDIVPIDVSRRIRAAAADRSRLVVARGASHGFLDRRSWLARLSARWLENVLS